MSPPATLVDSPTRRSEFPPIVRSWWARWCTLPEVRWAASALALFVAGLVGEMAAGPPWLYWAFYLGCYAAGGWEPGLAGLRALRAKTLDVDLLMVVAAIGAATIGQVMDGALLIVIFATSGALEALATARTEESVRGLLDLTPDSAALIRSDGTEQTVKATDLEIGHTVLVRPGERITADGTVVWGASEVDQATITGEPLPVDKGVGDGVFAGTLNGTGSLRVRVDRRAEDSVVARIAGLVEQASRTKAATQLFIEKIEQRYSVGMVIATVALFVVPLVGGEPVRDALLRAMTFMIVASPCAVVLATMPPLLAAIANAGRHGVLVKSAVVMERLGTTTTVAFDKTGTLTRGTPTLADVHVLPGVALGRDEVLRLAAAVERNSEHPLAGALVEAAADPDPAQPPIDEFCARPGRGVAARVGGRHVQIGSPKALLTGEVDASDAMLTVASAREDGRTAVVVLVDGRPVAVLGITDQVRPEAAVAVAGVARVTGAGPVLLTGDNGTTATDLARRVGVTDVRADLLPEDKVSVVRELESGGHRVMVVGDGINDAPAMAAAHAGVAMGAAGADLAVHTADVVVVRDDLRAVPAIISLSRHARRIVTVNLAIAATFIAALVVWDLIGHLPLPLGVAGHEGSTVIVGLNGLRLLRPAAWRRAGRRARPGLIGRRR